MKIISINGSPKGKASNTNVMVSAFLKGAGEAGAETLNIFLAEKDIKQCKGCYSCWTTTPGKCVTNDDMAGILELMQGVDVIILATPVYFNNISGTLKVFMDRLAVTGNPHKKEEKKTPPAKLIMTSNCGFPHKSQFDIVSLWIKRIALIMQTEVIGEIYFPSGKNLTSPSEELQPVINNYLKFLEKAGKEIATGMTLSTETQNFLEQNLLQ